MPMQALPIDLPLNWDLALPLGPALLAVLLVVVAVGLVLTLSASAAVESKAHQATPAPRAENAAGPRTKAAKRRKPQPIAA